MNENKREKTHRNKKNPRSADLHREAKHAKNALRPKQQFVSGQWIREAA